MTGRDGMGVRVLLAAVFLLAAVPATAVEYAGRLFRDPFGEEGGRPASPSPAATEETPFLLQGVIWSSDHPQALINGKVVRPGDTINDAEVLDIRKDGVKMRDKDKEFYLRFRKGAVS